MKTIATLLLLGSFAAGVVGCSAHADVDPHGSSTATNGTDYTRKTTTVKDADGRVLEKKTTETHNP